MPGKQAPDMGITDPAPHSTVIEAKYFRGNTLDEAQKALANSVYEAFYYRALPNLEANDDAGPWSFDYGCLIAYDTTERGLLHEAWSRLASDVRKSFWTGAGVKVILLGGE